MPGARRSLSSRAFGALAAIGLLLALAGCAEQPTPKYVSANASYTSAQAQAKAATVDIGGVDHIDVKDAVTARTNALTLLRRHGTDANHAADVLTSEFPVETKAVPIYVEAATFDGVKAWLVVEAWGGHTGPLARRRLWVIDRASGDILLSAVPH
jgi:hypothetical protein